MKYFALLTKLGENLLAQATALGSTIELTHMAVGDGGGILPTPDTNQTKLIAEKRRAAINTLFIDDNNKNQIIAEQIIPESEGGWWIREIGLFDKTGNLIAVANCPETYKPQLAEGSGRTQSIRMVLIVSHTESVTLKIDPSVVLATREYVNTEITVRDKKIDVLSAQTQLNLNKKIDKANISGVKGNDNDKVPSLNLLTTELGKLGNSATRDVGQVAGTVAAGDDNRILAAKKAVDDTQIGRPNQPLIRINTPDELSNLPAGARRFAQNAPGVSVLPTNTYFYLEVVAKRDVVNGTGILAVDASNPENVWLGVRYNATTNPDFTWSKYATSKELTNRLNGKLDKAGGTLNGDSNVLNLKNTLDNSSVYLSFSRKDGQVRGWVGAGGAGDTISLSNKITGKTLSLTPEGNLVHDGKSVMHVGDYGWGGTSASVWPSSETAQAQSLKASNTVTQTWRANITTLYQVAYSANAYFKTGDTWFNMSASYNKGVVTIAAGNGVQINMNTLYGTANTTTDRNGNLKVSGADALSDYPVGSPIPWPQAATPSGFLVCNGQSFNKTTYPLLASAYPSGVLPDLRGEFIRGLDSGRNVDSARTVLSTQGDAIRDIEGGFTIDDQVPNTNYPPFGAFKVIPGLTNYDAASDMSNRGRRLEFKASYSGVPTANENRPRNIAFLYIVRAA